MALIATYSTVGEFETAEEGKYLCTISGVKMEDRASFDDPNVMEPNFVFEYETQKERDSKGRPFKFFDFTKTEYGHEKAKLTLRVNGFFGRAFTKEQVAQMDFEKLVGKTVGVIVGTTANGKNKVLSVRAVPSSPIRFEDVSIAGGEQDLTPPPAGKDANDPFEDNF